METGCFAILAKSGKCAILKDGVKCTPDCRFRQTRAEHEASRKKADERLASLPEVHQRHIADTYNGGGYLWLRKPNGKPGQARAG